MQIVSAYIGNVIMTDFAENILKEITQFKQKLYSSQKHNDFDFKNESNNIWN